MDMKIENLPNHERITVDKSQLVNLMHQAENIYAMVHYNTTALGWSFIPITEGQALMLTTSTDSILVSKCVASKSLIIGK